MTSIDKFLKKIGISQSSAIILVMIIFAFLVYRMYGYNLAKSQFQNSFDTHISGSSQPPIATDGGVRPANPGSQNESPASISGIQGTPEHYSDATKQIADPSELLPTDNNSEWTGKGGGSGEIDSINLLTAGHLSGVNTVGSSLRNANLQIRSEPPNPRVDTGPWSGSTIESDQFRPVLEIGRGGSV